VYLRAVTATSYDQLVAAQGAAWFNACAYVLLSVAFYLVYRRTGATSFAPMKDDVDDTHKEMTAPSEFADHNNLSNNDSVIINNNNNSDSNNTDNGFKPTDSKWGEQNPFR
jgi:hypothetical protein